MTPISQMTEEELRVAVAEARGLPKTVTRWRIEYSNDGDVFTSSGWQSCADADREANQLLNSGWKVSVPESYEVANDPPELDANAAESLCNALAEQGWKCHAIRDSAEWKCEFHKGITNSTKEERAFKVNGVWVEVYFATGPTLSIAIARAYLAVVQSQTPTTP